MSVHHEDKGHSHHTKAYILVWAALLVLTVITVWISYFDFGEWNLFVAMLVATIKATLVCLYFMHLKYDNRMDQVVFISSFVFLAIFIALTLSDVMERPKVEPVNIVAVQGPVGDQSAKMKALLASTPAQISAGKTLYQVNCATCHGPEGKGDGAAAAALTPKPRNFTTSDSWKNGRAPSQIYKTLTEGVAGSAMASFATLSVEDRWALVHYVDSLGPTPSADTPASLAAIGIKDGADKGPAVPEQVEVPVQFAIDRMIQEADKK